EVETCVRLSQLRGGAEVLEEARSLGGAAVERATARMGETMAALEARGAADRVQIDLGLLRDLGYYSGAILEVYDPALGHVIGGGGRYDDLMKGFGLDLSAAGFALYLERVHVAQMEESRRGGGAR
ncbi:MAG TPA: ATP phosphoribosyltransferase regulatory subunit, partial [Solirubrobacterales bacterium]|nr:ATP phosphoribosyltransferase regulatory subunit [Solirubrobacterales bacterium]